MRSVNAQTPAAIGSNSSGRLRYYRQLDEVAVYAFHPLSAARVAEHHRIATTGA